MSDTQISNKQCSKFQIKSFEDPTFGITLIVDDREDPETLALEHLGYFVVPETSIE